MKTAAPLAVIRADDFETAKREVIAAGGTITLELFEYPAASASISVEPGGAELGVWTRK